MKKISTIFLTCIILLTLCVVPTVANTAVSVEINGAPVEFDVAPQIMNDRTMVPMRKIFESLGATVTWDGETKTATGVKDDTTVAISVDSDILYKNGTPIQVDSPAVLIDDRTLVPVRFIAESFDCDVQWDNDTRTVKIDATPAKAYINATHDKITYLEKEYVAFGTQRARIEKDQVLVRSVRHENGGIAGCMETLYSVKNDRNSEFLYMESGFPNLKSNFFVVAEKAQEYQSIMNKLSNKNNFLSVVNSETIEVEGKKHYLSFFDDFNGDRLDPSKWELCPEERRQNVGGRWDDSMTRLDGNGNLIISSALDSKKQPISGAIRSMRKFEQTTGYFEIRCRLQKAPGFWSAFWLMSETQHLVGNGAKDGVEIDVFESYDVNEKMIHQALHWDGYGEAHKTIGNPVHAPDCYDGAFHTFSMLWTDKEYVFYIDGKETYRLSEGDADFPGACTAPAHMLISSEFGTWAGKYSEETLPDNLMVDYVKVYIAG